MAVKLEGISRHLSCKAPKLFSEISESSDLTLIEAGSGAHPIGQICEHAEMVKEVQQFQRTRMSKNQSSSQVFPFPQSAPGRGSRTMSLSGGRHEATGPEGQVRGGPCSPVKKVEYYENNAGKPDSEV
jgi:hypothetical protein